MSAASRWRCIFCRLLPPQSSPGTGTGTGSVRRTNRRTFHATAATQARRKPTFVSIRAVDLGLIRSKKPSEAGLDAPLESHALTQVDPLSGRARHLRKYNRPPPPPRKSHGEEYKHKRGYFQPYSDEEKRLLALKYTPEQIDALEAGEDSIRPEDVAAQGRMRDDAWRLDYEDDLSRILPWIDHPVRAPDEDIDPDIRPLTEEETNVKFAAFYQEMLEKQDRQLEHVEEGVELKDNTVGRIKDSMLLGVHPFDGLTPEQRVDRLREYAEKYELIDVGKALSRFCADPANFFYSPKGTLHSQQDVMAQKLPALKDPRVVTVKEGENPALERLSLASGRSIEEINALYVRALVSHRVVNQTRMGKIQSMYVLSVAGNGMGMLGIGEGKGAELEDAHRKSRLNAVRNMKPVPMYEDRTIYGDVEAKVAASIVQLSSRPAGFGNRCQFLIFELARAAGIKDLSARCLRSRNKMNVVKAAYEALMSQRLPDEVARARGRKMVDVRNVYYSGRVLPAEAESKEYQTLARIQGVVSDEVRQVEDVRRLLDGDEELFDQDDDDEEEEYGDDDDEGGGGGADADVEESEEDAEDEDGLVNEASGGNGVMKGGEDDSNEAFQFKNWDDFVEEPEEEEEEEQLLLDDEEGLREDDEGGEKEESGGDRSNVAGDSSGEQASTPREER